VKDTYKLLGDESSIYVESWLNLRGKRYLLAVEEIEQVPSVGAETLPHPTHRPPRKHHRKVRTGPLCLVS